MMASCLLGIPAMSLARGDFPVGEADIRAMTFIHYYNADNKHRDADFTWSFRKDAFTLKKGKADIPAALVAKLLPEGATADEIEGKWALKDGMLVLSEIEAGKQKGRKDVRLSVYKTAPTVVRIGYDPPQYVFRVDR
jgi:hypothetical protein